MNKIFDMDGPVFTTLNRLADLVWLNILYIICCIPVFTIGASTTALYYVTMKIVKNEEGYITRSFFKSFKMNFRQATLLWLLALAVGGILALDYSIMTGRFGDTIILSETIKKVFVGVLFGIGSIYIFIMTYLFPLLAKFDNSIKNIIRNSFLISIRHLPYTVVLILIAVIPIVLIIVVSELIPLLFLILFSLIAFTSSYVFVRIFANYIPSDSEQDTDTAE